MECILENIYENFDKVLYDQARSCNIIITESEEAWNDLIHIMETEHYLTEGVINKAKYQTEKFFKTAFLTCIKLVSFIERTLLKAFGKPAFKLGLTIAKNKYKKIIENEGKNNNKEYYIIDTKKLVKSVEDYYEIVIHNGNEILNKEYRSVKKLDSDLKIYHETCDDLAVTLCGDIINEQTRPKLSEKYFKKVTAKECYRHLDEMASGGDKCIDILNDWINQLIKVSDKISQLELKRTLLPNEVVKKKTLFIQKVITKATSSIKSVIVKIIMAIVFVFA